MSQKLNQSGDALPTAVSIIEDNRFVREAWEAVLHTASSIEILGSYPSFEEALRSPSLGTSDVVLMDIGLPGMSGIDGVKYLKANHPNVAVVMCTVHDDDQSIFDAICAGAVGYLLKKVPPEELIEALEVAARGGSPITPNVARKVLLSFQVVPRGAESGGLTDREHEVLHHMAQGKSYGAIASELSLSLDGIRYHVRHIYEKLQVHSRSEAVATGLKNRLLHRPR